MPPPNLRLPVVGILHQDQPIEPLQDQTLTIPDQLVPDENCYLLFLSGDWLREEGILDGDVLVVQPDSTAHPGSLLIIEEHGRATVKKTDTPQEGHVIKSALRRYE